MSQFLGARPNLIDTSNNKSNDSDTSSDSPRLVTDTRTDMKFELLANEEKMVPEDKRQFMDRDNKKSESTDTESSSSSRSSRSSTSTRSSRSKKSSDSKNKIPSFVPPQPKGGQSGPSFGDGSTNREKKRPEEMTDEELYLEKLEWLTKLGELTQQGIKLSQNYNLESDIKSMKFEYDLHTRMKAKSNGVEWMANFTVLAVQGLEMANEKYDPFSLKLKGWGDQVHRDINSYYDVFGELYEKYAGKGKKMAPEIKLMFMIVLGAGKFHMMNSFAADESLEDKLEGDPDLAETLRAKARADKMKDLSANQQEKFREYANKQHEEAMKKASNLNNLQNAKREFQIKQEMIRKQNELNNLRQQLSEASVDENEPKINGPAIPPEMARRMAMRQNPNYENEVMQQQYQEAMRQQQMQNQMMDEQMKQVHQNQMEQLRQMQIEEQKRTMIQKELEKKTKDVDVQSIGTKVSLSPGIQSLLKSNGSGFIKSADDSDSTGSFLESLSKGNKSKVKKTKKQKRSIPKIDTKN